MTAEEVASNNTSGRPSSNAPPCIHIVDRTVTELMSRSKKAKPLAASDTPSGLREAKPAFRKLDPRDGLGAYIDHPEANPEGRVVEYDDDFVVINDKFPKASVHLLLIPRKIEYHKAHPLHILSTDANFRLEVEKRVARLKKLAALELRRQYGHLSVSDTPYQAALEELMSSPIPPPSTTETVALPAGRHWLSDIVTGVHTHPSMSHLHIHIFSRDMHSPCLKHKKHYLSFNSSFLVRLDEFPLRKGSERFHPGDWPNWDMKCWRCGKNFKNKFAALKVHLDEEFETWAKE
ncbi:HIT-like protein [Plenodomus tracheiphilus IPT5]|uniref:Aprataxin-like protein n=1 Tax=Plenodomus tracheiphilus IPT5 TaxID=1408161 RepID=A0A6A7B815_9PLEO|nr:HIT-like protein [Plenodomus tracheiphilus IPT5]